MAQIEMKPTMYVDIYSQYSHNPIAQSIKAATLGTAEPVDLLVHGDAEANIAVTNSVESALRMIKMTERTSIVLVYESKDQEEAQAFASRFPDRISAIVDWFKYKTLDVNGAKVIIMHAPMCEDETKDWGKVIYRLTD